ncbi:MAG: hypothetical protein H7333_11615, partial [Bdellovibrionales bacterium]|nr:hypothetical protein [Oligoflexia bacterium]
MKSVSPRRLAAIAFLVSFSSLKAHASRFGLNDVTILLPLPPIGQIAELIAPAAMGSRGVLLAKDIYFRFPALDSSFDAQTLYDRDFKVIGIRIDPCFAEGSSTTCRKQIRLVWQPVQEVVGATVTLDAALHTFYEFNDSEWNELVREWSPLAKGNLTES